MINNFVFLQTVFPYRLTSLKITAFCVLLVSFICSCSQVKESDKYLAQTPPGQTSEVFAPGIISRSDVCEFGSVFKASGTEIYFCIDQGNRSEIWYSRLEEDTWTKPEV